ncbi:GGDEF domain-containing protein [Thiomicrorhabdus hydrogeniphila]
MLFSIFLVNLLFVYFAPSEQVSIAQSVLFPVVSLLLPLNIFVWSLLPEKGIQHQKYNGFVASIFLLQALFFYWLMTELPLGLVENISLPVIANSKIYHLTFVSTLMFLIAGFVLSIRLNSLNQLRIFNHSVVFILLLMAFALNQYMHDGVLAWVSTIAGLMIILSLVFDAHHIAYTDDLTGLKGRRALNESFMGLGKRYAMVMVDIDHFKQFNDTYGHDVGDQVLKMVAAILDTVSGGKAYRFGGEEFTLVFKNKSADYIIHEVERLRVDIANEAVCVEVKDKSAPAKRNAKRNAKPTVKEVSVTISLGLAAPDKQHTTPEQVLKFADEGLYKAKKSGRNKLVVSKAANQPVKKSRGKKPPIIDKN